LSSGCCPGADLLGEVGRVGGREPEQCGPGC